MVSVTKQYSHVAYCGVNYLFWGWRSGCGVAKSIWLCYRLFWLDSLLFFFLFFLICLFYEIIFAYWLNDCAWCIQELMCITIGDHIFEQLVFKGWDETCREGFITYLWVEMRLLFLRHNNDWIEVFSFFRPMFFDYLNWLLIVKFRQHHCWRIFFILRWLTLLYLFFTWTVLIVSLIFMSDFLVIAIYRFYSADFPCFVKVI